MRKPEGPDHFVCGFAVVTQVLSGMEASIAVVLQKIEEVIALYEVELTRLQRLSRQFIRLPGYCRVQSQYFACVGYTNDQSLAITRCRRKLHTSAADDENASRTLTFNKEHRTLWIGAGVFDTLQNFQRWFGEFAEKSRMTQLADQTILSDLQAVRRAHAVQSSPMA